tara:strand:+ start:1867 stop:2358 length:492 start_codon:yes stop_codon:yes gene_type:complete
MNNYDNDNGNINLNDNNYDDNYYHNRNNGYYNYNYNNNNNTDYGDFGDDYLINFAFIFFISIVFTSIFCNRDNNITNTNRRRRNNLNQRLLNEPTYNPDDIEKKEIKYNNEIHHDRECTICLEEYQENDELYQLQCDHYYHKECINDWLLKHQTCPLCRLNLL